MLQNVHLSNKVLYTTVVCSKLAKKCCVLKNRLCSHWKKCGRIQCTVSTFKAVHALSVWWWTLQTLCWWRSGCGVIVLKRWKSSRRSRPMRSKQQTNVRYWKNWDTTVEGSPQFLLSSTSNDWLGAMPYLLWLTEHTSLGELSVIKAEWGDKCLILCFLQEPRYRRKTPHKKTLICDLSTKLAEDCTS